MFTSPFANITPKTEKKLTFSLIYLLLITILTMQYFNSYLVAPTSTMGIIDFELAKTVERSQEILDGWTPMAKTYAGLSLGFDFLFLLIYTLFISLIIHKLNVRVWAYRKPYRIGEILIWSMFITAILDTVENVCLIKLLVGRMSYYWSSVAYFFAMAKFVLIGISIIYIIYNTFLLLTKKSV